MTLFNEDALPEEEKIYNFPYKVYVDHNLTPLHGEELTKWLSNIRKGTVRCIGYNEDFGFAFKNRDEALLFKLTWGGECADL
jgi:hypothetical protein